MTLYEFNSLDERKQHEAIWEGVHLANREDEEHTVWLYQIDGFYVEVYCHKGYNAVPRYRAFSSTEQLQPYLEKIRLKI